MVEKYGESGPSSVCMTCCGIGHEQMGSYGDQEPRCIIFADFHKTEDHQCGVTGCNMGLKKICIHLMVKCTNCGGGYPANSNQCALKHRAERDVRKISPI